MTARTVHHAHAPEGHSGATWAIFALGVLGAVSAALTGVLSFTDSLDPPEWVRITMTSGIPVALFGAPLVWLLVPAARHETLTKVGMTLVGLMLVAFVVMLNVGY